MKELFNKKILSWAFYGWANSAYATIVLTVFFPLVFSNYWFSNTGSENSATPLGIANATASLVIVILAPVLGAIADRGGMKNRARVLHRKWASRNSLNTGWTLLVNPETEPSSTYQLNLRLKPLFVWYPS